MIHHPFFVFKKIRISYNYSCEESEVKIEMTMDVFRLSFYYIYILLISYQVKNLNIYVIFIEYYLLFNIIQENNIYIYIYIWISQYSYFIC